MKAIQLRSPLNVSYSSEDSSFASCDFSIFVNRDVTNINTNTVADYSLIAEPINNRVNFEIAELIRSKNDYLYEDDFYTARDTATYVLLRAVLLDSDGDEIDTKYNFFKVRDGYVDRNEVQLLNSEINPDPRTWSDNDNTTISTGTNDSFSGTDAYSITDTTDPEPYILENKLQLTGIHTLSCFVLGGEPIQIGKDSSNYIIINPSTGIILGVVGDVLSYDIFRVGEWFKISIVQNMSLNDGLRIRERMGAGEDSIKIFNPTIIKGNLVNFTPSEVLLQSNTTTFSSDSIEPKVMFDRKESVSYNAVYFVSPNQDLFYGLKGIFAFLPLKTSFYLTSTNLPFTKTNLSLIGNTLEIIFKLICEPKYTPVKVSFINKFGVIQDLVFFKKREDSFNTTQQDFKANILRNGTYLPHTGQKQIINKQASAKVKLNTGFYPEDFNEVFKQLQYSTNYWIDDEPAILTGSNFAFKTSVNDKLINYSFDFEYANPDINDIR
jgi:hypothetical protein